MVKNRWKAMLAGGGLICLIIAVSSAWLITGNAQKAVQASPAQSGPATTLTQVYLPLINPNSDSGSSFYIDSNNGSDSNSGTDSEHPWKTLSKLDSAPLLPGTTINLKRDSSWTGKLYLHASGRADKPITITAYGSGAAPSLSNPRDTTNQETVLALFGGYYVVENLHIQDSSTGIGIYSEHNIVQNSELNNLGVAIVINSQSNLITHNYIHDLHPILNTRGGDGDDWGALGVDILNSHNEISFNRFLNCEAPSYDFGLMGAPVEIYQLGDYTSVHHNWTSQSAKFMEVSSDGTGSATHVTIDYNVILNARNFGAVHISDRYATRIQDFRVENNTIVVLRTNDPLIGGYFSFEGTLEPGAYSLRNNIIYLSDYWWVSHDAEFRHQNNLYYLRNPKTSLGFTLDPSELLQQDPQFADLARSDFHLMPTSPAVDRGLDLGYSTDFDQNLVPVGKAPDLGAFEYGGK